MSIAEKKQPVRDFVVQQGLTFAVLLDERSQVAQRYNVRGIPSSFFIDREGLIQAKHTGPLDEPLIDRYIERLLR